ncbi:hypothetical protein TWF481_005020 [Arthrobotrys musiformis]|uniref:Nephrocystin 3-like N-terminal domain-containing protein n=1 Tax=Arthrobotrys musiformis TaxID=47236 RepID=A0AAV9WLD0_9PEZI
MIMIGIINELEFSTKPSQVGGEEVRRTVGLQLPQSSYFSYFFCQGTNENLNTAASVLKGLLLYLVKKNPNLAVHLQKRYDISGDSFGSIVDVNLLQLILFDILDDPSNPLLVFCVDALDECLVDSDDLMAFVNKSIDHSPRIRWLLSSRPHQDILSSFASQDLCVEIILERNQLSIDTAIGAYIDIKVSELNLKKQYRERDRVEIKRILKERSGGTYLWVHLACKELETSEALSCEAVSLLDQMPSELTGIYARMMEQAKKLDITTCGRCFDILATAAIVYRPLRLEELGYIAIRVDHVPDVRRLVNLCGSFLKLENEYVHFTHQSAQDYLISDLSELFTTAGPASRHQKIFENCMWTLSNPQLLKKDLLGLGWPGATVRTRKMFTNAPVYHEITEDQRGRLNRIEYACCYWARHLEFFALTPMETEIITGFFGGSFLYWLEATALMEKLSTAAAQLHILQRIKDVSGFAAVSQPYSYRITSLTVKHDYNFSGSTVVQKLEKTAACKLLLWTLSTLFNRTSRRLRRRLSSYILPSWLSPLGGVL